MLGSWRSCERDTGSFFSRRPPLSDQPLPMPSYTPSSIRGKALEQEFQDLLHKQAIEQAPQTPGFYSRLFVVQKHHRPVYPEHLNRISAISHGDSSVRPPSHSPRRLVDLPRSAGRIPPGSGPSGIASVSSLHHGRSPLPVQGAVLRTDNCPSGLYTVDGSNVCHSPLLRYI